MDLLRFEDDQFLIVASLAVLEDAVLAGIVARHAATPWRSTSSRMANT